MAIGKGQFSYLLVSILLFLSLSAMAVKVEYYKDCGLPSDKLHIRNVTVNPISDDLMWGWEMTLTVFSSDGQPYDCEEGTYMKKVVKLGLVKIGKQESEFCKEDISRDVSSPSVLVWKDKVLKIAKVSFDYSYNVWNADDEQVFCLELKIRTSNTLP